MKVLKVSSVAELRVIAGNPLAVRSEPGKSGPQLVLIRGESVSGKSVREARRAERTAATQAEQSSSLLWRGWQCLNRNGNAITVVLALAAILGTAAWNIFSTYSRLGKLEIELSQISNDLSGLKGKFGKLEGAVANLQGRLGSPPSISYEEKAVNLGLKEPQVQKIALSPSVPPATISQADGAISYDITLSVAPEQYLEGFITFTLDGTIGFMTFKNSAMSMPRQVGAGFGFRQIVDSPDIPDLWLKIIDFPTPDSVVVAIGINVSTGS